jgi:hypothetical protein
MMRFQSLLMDSGMTGWMLSVYLVPSAGPILKSQFDWKGTLMSDEIGLLSFLARSAASSASAAVALVATVCGAAAVCATAAGVGITAAENSAAEVVSSDKQPVIMFRFMMLVWLKVSPSLRWPSRFGKKFIAGGLRSNEIWMEFFRNIFRNYSI